MSEYQYYEFLAVDRPLTAGEMGELRAISTRARITPTSFVNTYEWGDLKARPIVLVEKYFAAFFYLANWGTRECMFRLPREKVDLKALEPYCKGDSVTLTKTASFVIFTFGAHGEEADEDDWTETGEGMLASLLPIRGSLLAGDLRPLYLRWLQRVQAEKIAGHLVEAPVPPGLGAPTGALQALVDLLKLDSELLEVAAAGTAPSEDGGEIKRWLERMPPEEKDGWLARVMRDPGASADLLREYRTAAKRPEAGRRTVKELVEVANVHREKRQKELLEQQKREQARYEAERAAERERHLKRLEAGEARAWTQVDELIAHKPAKYGEAVELLKDLGEVCRRSGRDAEFRRRIRDLRNDHAKKGNFIRRLDNAELGGSGV
jgi:hypothetical protein